MAATRRLKPFVALLRGINVGAAGKGRKSVPMARLRELAEGCGWQDVRTYIQSGNVVFRASGSERSLARALESALADAFAFEVPVVVRSLADLDKVAAGCPFADAADERPNLVHVGFARDRLKPSFAADVEPYCKQGERVRVEGQAIWIDFPAGVGRSKVTPSVLDRAAGSPVTMRNVKTLRAVIAMAGQ